MCLRSCKNNLQCGIPTDCARRDEHSGWTTDAEQQSQEGCYYTNMTAFYNQWLLDMRETKRGSGGYVDNLVPRQGARAGAIEEDIPWSSASINVPSNMYMATAGKSIVEEEYECMKRFINWCVATSNLCKRKKGRKDYTADTDC